MDIDKIIELTKEEYLADEALPYSLKKANELIEDDYVISTANYDITNNLVDIIFIKFDEERPITHWTILIAELKEE